MRKSTLSRGSGLITRSSLKRAKLGSFRSWRVDNYLARVALKVAGQVDEALNEESDQEVVGQQP